jgi:hypothetical protein
MFEDRASYEPEEIDDALRGTAGLIAAISIIFFDLTHNIHAANRTAELYNYHFGEEEP